jgi:predicted nucleic acid-binding protein
MKISTQLAHIKRIFLDTAPVIYYVEKHPVYADKAQAVFDALDTGQLDAVSSPVTLSECLVVPYRLGKPELAQAFLQCLVNGENVSFVAIDETIADKAAELRARYNLSLPDALQIAVALAAGCDAFLTNDAALKRVTELEMLVLDDVDAD